MKKSASFAAAWYKVGAYGKADIFERLVRTSTQAADALKNALFFGTFFFAMEKESTFKT